MTLKIPNFMCGKMYAQKSVPNGSLRSSFVSIYGERSFEAASYVFSAAFPQSCREIAISGAQHY